MISIVVPCFEDKENLKRFITTVEKKLVDLKDIEVLLVDDGNNFNINELINNKQNIKLIHNLKNKGYGFSIKKGVLHSSGDIIAIIDCDNSYNFDELISQIVYFKKSNLDALIGFRTFKYNEGFFRKLYRRLINRFASIIFDCDIKDINSGIRVFKKSDFVKYEPIYPNKFSLSSTHTLSLVGDNKKIKYFETTYEKRLGKSKINLFLDPLKFIILIFKIFLIFDPLKFF